jgi:uncharacterized lipoprotein YddW (UPF0748 family)
MKNPTAIGWLRSPGRLLWLALAIGGGCVMTPEYVTRPAPPAEAPVPPPPPPPPPPAAEVEVDEGPPPPEFPREFRGVWVAAVSNMDWPSRPGLSTERQQAELIGILDRATQLGLNAVILQVRPAGDALYASPHEPWSEYLTGTMGTAPQPFYDPLEFAIREAHRRGLELHAWFNPYRARHPSAKSPASADHISRARPSLVRRYGTHLWMDPGERAVQDHTVRVILDVVRRYDIDGVHIDDYFYPYREYDRNRKLIQFPDEASYGRYRSAGGSLARNDWRRHNVDQLVERLYTEIKREKPAVKFGISPFGIWRPGHPAQIRGLDAYEEIFADARKWLNHGWLDYFAPQLYWPIDQVPQSFPVLLDWWVGENREGRHIWPGGFAARVGVGANPWPASEIISQIEVTRSRPGATGHVHFNMTTLMRNRDGLSDQLTRVSYARPALVPPSPWLHAAAPARPQLALRERTPARTVVAVTPGGTEPVFLWAVRERVGSDWSLRVVPGAEREIRLAGSADRVVVTPVGRTGNEGPPAVLAPLRAGGAALESEAPAPATRSGGIR